MPIYREMDITKSPYNTNLLLTTTAIGFCFGFFVVVCLFVFVFFNEALTVCLKAPGGCQELCQEISNCSYCKTLFTGLSNDMDTIVLNT